MAKNQKLTKINKLCQVCIHDCKQDANINIVGCGKYSPQLEMKFPGRKKKPKVKA
ncbi:MAG: hypothetical protein PHQ23_01340 [Candidatus Wallbacteria bacterium]|nr:hypothetical protein [Candidatus Wallbacteria bacterium]